MDSTLLWPSCSFHLARLHSSAFVPSMWLSCLHSLPASSAALPSDSKVLRVGARSTTLGEKGRWRESASKRDRVLPITLSDTWWKHNVAARRGRLFSISGHHRQLMVMWHQHVPQQFLTWKASLLVFYFSWLWVTKLICSQRFKDAVKSTLHFLWKCKLCIKPAICTPFAQ